MKPLGSITPRGALWTGEHPRSSAPAGYHARTSPDELKRRIDQAARFVPLDQLCLSGQCGFSSTVEGNALTPEEQLAKLRLIVDVARDIWGD